MKFYTNNEGDIFYKDRDGHTDVLKRWENNDIECEYDSPESYGIRRIDTIYCARLVDEKVEVKKYPCEINAGNTLTIWFTYNIRQQMPKKHLNDLNHFVNEVRSLDYDNARKLLEQKLNNKIHAHSKSIYRLLKIMGKVD